MNERAIIQQRNEILAEATPWQIAELINYLAQNLEPFYNPDPSDKFERLSENPLFADLAKEPTTIKLYAIQALSNTLDRIRN
jgi:two-component sensor histidine kinase